MTVLLSPITGIHAGLPSSRSATSCCHSSLSFVGPTNRAPSVRLTMLPSDEARVETDERCLAAEGAEAESEDDQLRPVVDGQLCPTPLDRVEQGRARIASDGAVDECRDPTREATSTAGPLIVVSPPWTCSSARAASGSTQPVPVTVHTTRTDRSKRPPHAPVRGRPDRLARQPCRQTPGPRTRGDRVDDVGVAAGDGREVARAASSASRTAALHDRGSTTARASPGCPTRWVMSNT